MSDGIRIDYFIAYIMLLLSFNEIKILADQYNLPEQLMTLDWLKEVPNLSDLG